jgi:Uma2 family endonuclease
MNTLEEIKLALERLSLNECETVATWLQEVTNTGGRRHTVVEPQAAYALAPPPHMTIDEYFEFEEHSHQFRHEYVNGAVYAMSGPSLDHGRIAGELFIAFKAHLRGGPCEAFATDIRLQVRSETDEIVYYPDLIVACNRGEWGKDFVCNPKLVAEVLSPATRNIDCREKAMTYRRVSSIEEYVLLEQKEHKITVHRRAEGWKPRVYTGLRAVAEFRSVALSLPLSQLYEGTLPAV